MNGRTSGILAAHFQQSYLRSLADYRFFYDDVAEVGRADDARHVFYFVPGINGTPGQMRFLLPSLTRVFGGRIYLKALHLPEFSARVPTWEKYTVAHAEKKLAQLRADLRDLLARFDHFAVLCSSNGFYDFLAAARAFDFAELESRVALAWGACAPDRFDSTTRWEKLFFPLNGFMHAGHRWFAYPNHNLLTAFNPETGTSFAWRDTAPRRLHKVDLESRFRCLGLQWDYLSTSQISAVASHVIDQVRRSWGGPAEALVAAKDGYWNGTPPAEIEHVIRRYLPRASIEFKATSHLWVVNPTNVTALLERLQSRLPPLASARSAPPFKESTFAK